jgi:endonuclease-3
VSPSTVSQTSVPTVRVSASTARRSSRSAAASASTAVASAPAASATDGTSGPVGRASGRFVVMAPWHHGGATSELPPVAPTSVPRAPTPVPHRPFPPSDSSGTCRRLAGMSTEIPADLTRDSGKTKRAPVILDLLDEELPDAVIALHYSTTWELLVATMLSAQATDVKVNEVTQLLFRELDGPEAFAEASRERIEELIGSLGLFRQKAKNVQRTAQLLLERHGGEVPDTMEELTALPGVARKTANVVLSNGFGENEGVVVDTHVTRLSRRLRFTREETPEKIERDLMRLFPRGRWLDVADLLIHHGRRTCVAQRPRCHDCVVEPLCPSSQVVGRTDKR